MTVDGRRRQYVGRVTFIVVIVVFSLVNIYRSSTLSQRSGSSHEFFRRHQGPHHRRTDDVQVLSASDHRSTSTPAVDQLALVRRVREHDYPPYNVTLDSGQVHAVPLWLRRLSRRRPNVSANAAFEDDIIGPYYFLTELLQVRVYPGDKARWTVRELKQWLHYMLLAGVEHFYICDHFAVDSERLDGALRRYIDAGLVTYIAWDQRPGAAGAAAEPLIAQTRCYQRVVSRYRRRHRWQIAVDIDEYPFSPTDTRENFLARYLDQLSDDVSEISLANYLMLGEGNRTGAKTVISRVIRMTSQPANKLVKPVYRPDRLRAANVHRNRIEAGRQVDAGADQLRLLHYWGARGQRQDPEAARRMMSRTQLMTSMTNAWSNRVENSLLVFGELDAFSGDTGP